MKAAPFDPRFQQPQQWASLEELRQGEPRTSPLVALVLIVPLIPFLAVQVIWGMHEAPRLGIQEPAAYIIGRIIGASLIPLGIAWLAYACTDHSNFAAGMAFVVAIVFSCVIHVVANPDPLVAIMPDPTHGGSSSANPAVASFGDFEFELPEGWSRARPDRLKTRALLLLDSDEPRLASAVIKIDAGPPVLPTARLTARSLAGEKGHVFAEPMLLDGEEGIRVRTHSHDLKRPRYAVVVFRDDRVYLIMAATKGTDIRDDLKQVLDTWKWANDTPEETRAEGPTTPIRRKRGQRGGEAAKPASSEG